MEFKDLYWAITASQHRSLRQAAEALNVRQSTLSRGLRHLEDELSATLFERTNGGTRPTPAGQEFLQAARRILSDMEAVTTRLQTRSRGDIGHLNVGVHASLSAGNLRAALIEHRRRFPDMDTRLVDGSSERLLSDLANAAVDIAFLVEGSSRWDGNILPVWSERVVVALPTGHPLNSRDLIHWRDLSHEVLLLPQRGPGAELHRMLVKKLGEENLFKLVRHDVAFDSFLALVGADCGILLALEGGAGLDYPGVTFREVYDADGVSRMAFRACWRPDNFNPSLRPFVDMLRERYPDLSLASAPS